MLLAISFLIAPAASDASPSRKKAGRHNHVAHSAHTAQKPYARRKAPRRATKHVAVHAPKSNLRSKTKQSALPAAPAAPNAAMGKAAMAASAPAAAALAAAAQAERMPADKGSQTGLPLPRFAALRSDKVFFRRGPGQRYPIEWIYRRRGLPVKIEREFDVWRLVEDSDGVKAWVHQATLYGQRHFVIPSINAPLETGAHVDEKSSPAHADPQIVGYLTEDEMQARAQHVARLYHNPDTQSRVVAVLRPGVVGRLRVCAAASDWCQVNVKGYKGWLERKNIWGLLPDEVLKPD
ncbi:SH3 domain-containing protein [Candidatus Kirkpatrickella diaphorinae]|uniref:SH3 domain-containing protein n=1 Tax=Candidatus Kirkpatrickella diaphorinae TaxID=2984322 RepID=A0ABY6GKV8_9PROT|nr:SH3 domain-containing protein [Candidatus Kirkpatrickella diaphorinae]UYH51286.1 SH3 domain-containing protein [Candidatus Kirkpatrickella diaphorinae]